jgi:GTP pyrophosphokinase
MDSENYRGFIHRVRPHFKGRDFELIDAAYEFAKEGHGYSGQIRESGERYFEHPRAVALIVMDELKIFDRDVIIAALLHDVKEDCYLLRRRRIKLFFGKGVQKIVDLVTKPENRRISFSSKEEKLKWYFRRIINSNWETKTVKLADRLHNLRTLSACTPEKYRKQIDETRKYFIPLIESLKKSRPQVAKYFQEQFELFIGRWMYLW